MKVARLAFVIVPLLLHVRLAWSDAFVLNNGMFTTFSVPGATSGSTVATGVNDSGQIVGYFSDSTGRHGFLDTNGVFTKIDFPGAVLTDASGINNAGQIVGGFQATLAQLPEGFVESGGAYSAIPALGASSINNAGQIVGSLGTPGITSETAFLYSHGTITPLVFPFSDVLSSEGAGINDLSQVVGVYFSSTGGAHGFLDSDGAFLSIDAPGAADTYAYGINNAGEIVGFEQTGSQLAIQAFADLNGTFTTLQVPGGEDTVAYGINNHGEIVGSFAPTPEPTSFALLIAPLTTILVLRKRGLALERLRALQTFRDFK